MRFKFLASFVFLSICSLFLVIAYTPTNAQTFEVTPTPTETILTLTPAPQAPPAYEPSDAPLSATSGWTCDDFPCEDDISGWLQRIQVPPGFQVEHIGQFPGQPMQITYGPDGRLYATVLEGGTRSGAIYVMDGSGAAARYSSELISPLGLAFQPGTGALYVSARESLEKGTGIWRVPPGGGAATEVISGLPCCLSMINNQANGLIFGQDGDLYVGVGSITDTTENPPHSPRAYRKLVPNEASILQIDLQTGALKPYAEGIRNPFDLTQDSTGQFYATDNGLLTGTGGDRVLKVDAGANYGWPYYRDRGCATCAIKPAVVKVSPDLIDFPPFTLPRGIVAYTADQFPANMHDNLFVTLWNGVKGGQRVIRIDPQRVGQEGYTPEAFVTGLIRPIDVTLAPDGSLVVVDYVYGHVWRVVYIGGNGAGTPVG